MATVIDLGHTTHVGSRPQVENVDFAPWHMRHLQPIDGKLFWDMLLFLAKPSVRAIFGGDLRSTGRGGGIVTPGTGQASLGCLDPPQQPSLYIQTNANGTERVRLQLSGTLDLDLAVNDLRLYASDHTTVRRDMFHAAEYRLTVGVHVLLSLGLTQPFSSSTEYPPVHWLQVNNLHFEDAPAWNLHDERRGSDNPVLQFTSDRPGPSRIPEVARRRVGEDELEDLPF
jgi:hypothetical protein